MSLEEAEGAVAEEADAGETFRWFAGIREKDSPLYGRLSRLVGDRPALLEPLGGLPVGAHLPVLLFAAVHYLALGHVKHPLADVFRDPRTAPADDAALAADLASFLEIHAAEIVGLVSSRRTQTNEVNRCAVLAPAMRVARRVAGTPLALVEVGASAGLNLHFDRYRVEYSNGRVTGDPGSPVRVTCELRGGPAPPFDPSPSPETRAGLDLCPVDVADEAQVRWLRACLFPDQPERAARLRAAVEVTRSRGTRIRAGDVFDLLPAMVRELPGSVTPVILHTWVLAYLTAGQRADFAAMLGELNRERPLLWLGAEWPDALPGRPKQDDDEGTVWALARISGSTPQWRTLANSHDHGSWLAWRDRA